MQRRGLVRGLLGTVLLGACVRPGASRAQSPGQASGLEPSTDALDKSWTLTTSDKVRLRVLERAPRQAPGTAPTIVLVPGWCMPATIWRTQLDVFGARWRTLALDPRGQGESEVPVHGYTADRRADDIHDLIRDMDRIVLVGWSLGVLDALQYVSRHGSARLRGLALVDNSIGEPPVPKASHFLDKLRKDRKNVLAGFVRGMFTHPPAQEQLDALRDGMMRMSLEDSIALLSYPLPREHWRDVVHRFELPLAYLVTPRFREQSQHLLEARPASKVEIFEDAGHALFVDDAERFNRTMIDWIESFQKIEPQNSKIIS
jgi:microsomal epoxide hydrolase